MGESDVLVVLFDPVFFLVFFFILFYFFFIFPVLHRSSSRPYRQRKTSSMQWKRRDSHHKSIHRIIR